MENQCAQKCNGNKIIKVGIYSNIDIGLYNGIRSEDCMEKKRVIDLGEKLVDQ